MGRKNATIEAPFQVFPVTKRRKVWHLHHRILNGKDALLRGNGILQLTKIVPVGMATLLVLVWGPGTSSHAVETHASNPCVVGQPTHMPIPHRDTSAGASPLPLRRVFKTCLLHPHKHLKLYITNSPPVFFNCSLFNDAVSNSDHLTSNYWT
jgi:hypothetical protein